MQKKALQIYLPLDLHETLSDIAKVDHRSKSAQALAMLELGLATRLSQGPFGSVQADAPRSFDKEEGDK